MSAPLPGAQHEIGLGSAGDSTAYASARGARFASFTGQCVGTYYCDDLERGQALLVLTRCCRDCGGPLLVAGAEGAREEVCGALRCLDADAASHVVWLDLNFREARRGGAADIFRTALREICDRDNPIMIWAELASLRQTDDRREALCGYAQVLGEFARTQSIIVFGAFPRSVISAEDSQHLLECFPCLISVERLCSGAVLGSARWDRGRDIDPAARGPKSALGRYRETADVGLEGRQLLQYERLATLGQLAAGIAHELGNPLSFISASLQYLHQRFVEKQDPASEFTGTALEHVEQMDTLLRNMLDLAAPKRSDFRECDLRQLVSEVLSFTASEGGRLHIAVQAAFDSCPPVWADPWAIKQLVLNAVKNAFEAMAERGGSLAVRVRHDRPSGMAIVEFDNDGPAIPDDVLARLFQPFFTSKERGTGLGLYLCRRIAQDHHGEIQVENLPQGVRYRLSIPVRA